MATLGTYGVPPASKAALVAALQGVFAHAADPTPPTAAQQAQRLAEAIADWVGSVPVVVTVGLADAALQTAATPGSPTLSPAVPAELAGVLQVGP